MKHGQLDRVFLRISLGIENTPTKGGIIIRFILISF